MTKKTITISVRSLVETIILSGDLIALPAVSRRMKEGIVTHQHVQNSRGDNYQPEVSLKMTIQRSLLNLTLTGRMDGLISPEKEDSEGNTTSLPEIEEIKSYRSDVASITPAATSRHRAQLKMYGHMYLSQDDQHSWEAIDLTLVYVHTATLEESRQTERWSKEELTTFFNSLVNEYLRREEVLVEWEALRNQSNTTLSFPFSNLRKGQDTLMNEAADLFDQGGILFAEAPTGIGKTLGTLHPAVQAQGAGKIGKIFYLAAKTPGKNIAWEASEQLIHSGAKLKRCVITAKGRICFKERVYCHPEYCEYAKGYYEKITGALDDMFLNGNGNRETITQIAKSHQVCPFEFSLDFALSADIIICDYNYLFDPRVYLRRFFLSGRRDYCFLIDEAHNLVDRARGMYSASLTKKPILALQRFFKDQSKRSHHSGLAERFTNLNRRFIDWKKECRIEENHTLIYQEPEEDFIKELEDLAEQLDIFFSRQSIPQLSEDEDDSGNLFLDFWFTLKAFVQIQKNITPGYKFYITSNNRDVMVKLFCLDPGVHLSRVLSRGKGSLFFSATLRPLEYFRNLLGGGDDSFLLSLESPFPRGNKLVIHNPSFNTRYKHRESSYHKIADEIFILIKANPANSLIFFPSYQYLTEVHSRFVKLKPPTKVIVQKPSMTETEREKFLDSFNEEAGITGFVVMGGIFGEGIDLMGENLTNAVIVGVGLPSLGTENNILREYYQDQNGMGFEYAYIYPGMNRVMQAAGRVIRSEKDRGVILFLDDRFSRYPYPSLFPKDWQPDGIIQKEDDLVKLVTEFWKLG